MARIIQNNQNNSSTVSISDNEFNTLNFTDLMKNILKTKQFKTINELNNFLYPSLNNLHNPFLFNDMEKAVETIKYHIFNHSKIAIWGDYDVDGQTSSSALFIGLKHLNADATIYIPNRHNEGYGLNNQAIDILKSQGIDLIITVDCGISSVNEIAYAYSLGMKVIVTDHHEAPEILPQCEAILDAKVPNENYPFKELCGVGVAFKLLCALIPDNNQIYSLLDFVALGTVADLVPLIDENRIFVKAGLHQMNQFLRPGFAEMAKHFLNDNSIISTYHLGFNFGPMLNASGRLGNAIDGVKSMILTKPENLIIEFVDKINNLNEQRKNIQKSIINSVLKEMNQWKLQNTTILDNKEYIQNPTSIIMYDKNWEIGVIGVAASKIQETYHCPVILFGFDSNQNVYRGSGRSVEGIDLYDALSQCSDLFEAWGGHKMAAGLSIKEENLPLFINKFDNIMKSYPQELFIETYKYDKKVKIGDLKLKVVDELNLLEPTGMGNGKISFLLEDVNFKNVVTRGLKQEHYSGIVYDDTGSIEFIAFNQKIPENLYGLDCIISLSIDHFNEKKKLQCVIKFCQKSQNSIHRDLVNAYTTYETRVIDSPLTVLNMPEKKRLQFEKAGIETVQQLLHYFPKKYYDFRDVKTCRMMVDKEMCAVIGTIEKVGVKKIVYAFCRDEDGNSFMVSWFNQNYIANQLFIGTKYIFCGTPKIEESGFVKFSPVYFSKDIESLKGMVPVYRKIRGMSEDYLKDTISNALHHLANTDYIEKTIADDFNLMSNYDALHKLHHPKSDIDIVDAQKRIVFDNLFKFNLNLKDKNNESDIQKYCKFNKSDSLWNILKTKLPYQLTGDQSKVLEDMKNDIFDGKRLNALVQGDVGSGKTIVAFFMMLLAHENGFQSCIIAPTEVLAKQHYDGLTELMDYMNIKVGYLVGGMKAKERKEVLSKLKTGEISMIVGTHAVIQDTVVFDNLGLVVVDEQHRFGVEQREKLLNNVAVPHLITMSATPIPRTLSMALFGDNIQVYNIKEKPAGRKEIITKMVYSDYDAYNFMYEQIKQGRQCYVVCPLIDVSESDKMQDVISASEEASKLKEYFANYSDVNISVITGKMKKQEISDEISKFANKETNIIVSTTIIEVGVNIPNATVMLIKSSERFGLAQAHQLRGRVGRGKYQSYCLLQTTKDNDLKAEILCSTNDGFEIAKQDMQLRGTGDFIGTQQSGSNYDVDLMISNPDLYKQIALLNDDIIKNESRFVKYKFLLKE